MSLKRVDTIRTVAYSKWTRAFSVLRRSVSRFHHLVGLLLSGLWRCIYLCLKRLWALGQSNFSFLALLGTAIVAAVPGAALIADCQFETEFIAPLVSRDRGPCEAGQELRAGDFCVYPGTPLKFQVTEKAAYVWNQSTPWGTSINVLGPREAWVPDQRIPPTFQARELDDGKWVVVAAGPWQIADDDDPNCYDGLELRPGEYCVVPFPPAHFKVYGVPYDEDLENAERGYSTLADVSGEDRMRFTAAIQFDDGRGGVFLVAPGDDGKWSFERYDHLVGGARYVKILDSVGEQAQEAVARTVTEDASSDPNQQAEVQVEAEAETEPVGQTAGSSQRDGMQVGTEADSTTLTAGAEKNEREQVAVSEVTHQEREIRKNRIVERLFAIEGADADTFHDYADFGSPRLGPRQGECDGYVGGYSSWRIQTKSVAGDASTDEDFFSLTVGEVIFAEDGEGRGLIAVWDRDSNRTVLYANARKAYVVSPSNEAAPVLVGVGTRLGVQGGYPDLQGTKSEGVQIQVREGKWSKLACGRDSDGDGVVWPEDPDDPIDPVLDPYLYGSVTSAAD